MSKDHSICSGTKEKKNKRSSSKPSTAFLKRKKSLYLIIMKFGHILSLIMSYAGIIFKSVLMSLGKVELGSMTFTYQGQHTFFRVSPPLLPHLPFISKLWRHSQLPGICMLNSRFSICTVIADVLNSLTVFALCFVEAD